MHWAITLISKQPALVGELKYKQVFQQTVQNEN